MRDVPPILCVVGKKNSGKTTLTVALAAELSRRGRRVMTVKHGHGFQVDQPGRDSWRHRHEGGAIRTVLAGPGDFAVVGRWPDGEMPLRELVQRFLWDAEIVLAEGFKKAPEPKIEIFRRGVHESPIFGSKEGSRLSSKVGASGSGPARGGPSDPPGTPGPTLALVTDQEGLGLPIPIFLLDPSDPTEPFPSLRALADFVEETFLTKVTED